MSIPAYHQWLIKRRIYCECGNGYHLEPATQVIKKEGHDIVVCDFHAGLTLKQKEQHEIGRRFP